MKEIIKTNNAPSPIGPYNQAVGYGNLVFISGQIALDPKTGNVKNGDIQKETKTVMENLKAILAEAGLTFDHVLKTSIFISDMQNFAAINEVYAAYFQDATAPARETVEVSNLPKYVNVEISMIAGR